MITWTLGGPSVPGYDGPSVDCAEYVIVTKHDYTHLLWALYDKRPDGTLSQRFTGGTLAGDGDMRRAVALAMKMLSR